MTNLVKQFNNRLIFHDIEPFDILFRNFFETDSFFAPFAESKVKYPVDIIETTDGLRFEVAAPGLNQDDVEIAVKDGDILSILYDKTSETKEGDKYLHSGIAKRSFSMGWRIGNKFDLSKIEASMKNGLLTIKIPYSPEAELKKIKIKTE
jgi:HSP20 family molecular chaperone IbpA